MDIYYIRVKNTRNSFFGKVSELTNSKILMYVYKIPSSDHYLVLALSYGKDIDKIVKQLIINDYYLRKRKIIKIKYLKIGRLHVLYGLKSICEFYKLIEENNVQIFTPYVFNSGSREYIAMGPRDVMETYLSQISKYYTSGNVEFTYINTAKDLVNLLSKNSIMSVLTDKLTSSEMRILKNAFEMGYFEYPRNMRQGEIGSLFNLSKVTVCIHLRKALKKIVEDMIQFMDIS